MTAPHEKPRYRVRAESAPSEDRTGRTTDSYQNFEARLGIGADNLASASQYGFNPITRNRQQLEWMYRGSWIVGQAVDVVAEDMVRAGIDFGAGLDTSESEQLQGALQELGVWKGLEDATKWSRLYGGAIAVMLIDGQHPSTPLRPQTVGKGQFRGLLPLDRWMIQPTLNDTVQQLGPDLGKPNYYVVTANAPALQGRYVHHSRVVRLDGIELPFWQSQAENGWGMSVIERLYDRLVAFDSTTQGAAQLVHKAHLRILKIDKLRELLAQGGKAEEAVAKQVDAIRRFQSAEGLTLLDKTDEFETQSYQFSGLSDLLLQFGQQLSGALQIPLVRLFGQSPAGLNSSGESDLRTYYDGIASQQESRLRRPIGRLLNVLIRSELGREPPQGFTYSFEPLWQLSDKEKADIAKAVTDTVNSAVETAVITQPTALRELKRSSDITGVWSEITDEDIEAAEAAPPLPGELEMPEVPEPDAEPADVPALQAA